MPARADCLQIIKFSPAYVHTGFRKSQSSNVLDTPDSRSPESHKLIIVCSYGGECEAPLSEAYVYLQMR